MFIRQHALVALAATGLVATSAFAQSPGFAYAAGKQQYRTQTQMKMSQEMMGQKQDMELTTTQLVTLDVAKKGKDSLAFSVTLDSANVQSSMPVPNADVSKFIGAKAAGVMSPVGKILSYQVPSEEQKPAMDDFRTFFPTVVPTNKKVGDVWVDTVKATRSQGGMEVSTTAIVTSTFTGDTSVAGEKAWRIRRTVDVALSGSGEQQGTVLTIEGKGTGSRTDLVSPKGIYLGSSGKQTVNSTITLPANGMTIPMTQEITTSVERVKKS